MKKTPIIVTEENSGIINDYLEIVKTLKVLLVEGKMEVVALAIEQLRKTETVIKYRNLIDKHEGLEVIHLMSNN